MSRRAVHSWRLDSEWINHVIDQASARAMEHLGERLLGTVTKALLRGSQAKHQGRSKMLFRMRISSWARTCLQVEVLFLAGVRLSTRRINVLGLVFVLLALVKY